MNIKETLRYYFLGIRNLYQIKKAVRAPVCKLNHVSTELIRNTHSIEKGLSLQEQRLGFGHAKQQMMMKRIDMLKDSRTGFHQETRKMAMDCLRQYIDRQQELNHSDDFIEKTKQFLADNMQNPFQRNIDPYGGTRTLKKSALCFDVEEIERFFQTRHSVREFSGVPVKKADLVKAVQLAQTAPSACNRQAYRVYVLFGDKRTEMTEWLKGVGGVQNAEGITYILITSKLSAYRLDETSQHTISASIFAAYLSLTLHLYGYGVCICQRQVIWTKKWKSLQKSWDISVDEHAVCVLCVGQVKEESNVPISHRMDYKEIVKFIQ